MAGYFDCEKVAADDLLTKDGVFTFDPTRLDEAHKYCQSKVRRILES
jgi:hypothetical protein